MVHKPNRRFSAEYKAEAVELARKGEKSVSAMARDLGISPAALCRWLRKADAARGESPEELEELKRLRKEVETLRMERDFLKKAAAFFAKENK
jgi:transposase